ncbi:hypothetical protein [Amnibacterium kyonggiense]|uniref:Uncharacterized protein n=1 Tax=Amnibacterium kyonggiense TaxID=595671 RepID=A0A4R7FT82_9MICO|nr:hypothetical protein [Amnibacterium kyonggiense]TDS81105.1 hypothetical protein CLV52_1680 [Amnibacterium kyonggiense]
MPVLSIAETVTRPASAALDTWFPSSITRAGARADALVAEQGRIAEAIAVTVARMGVELDPDRLDALTEETTALFARAEELRLALALAARAADDTWLVALDLD